MADKKGPTATANKMAMSRALGAAFLNHQVEQLEKSVSNGPASGNWRDRRQHQANNHPQTPPPPATRGIISYGSKRPPPSPGVKPGNRKRGGEIQIAQRDRDSTTGRPAVGDSLSKPRSSDEEKEEKDADVVVVDASVLVHALYQVKKWCRDGREEVVIVPLEALNTLDLLKKGTSPLAQRARAASRILEAQVGTNPRIRVQRDDAFVLWDKIAFKDLPVEAEADKDKPATQSTLGSSPEWVRRTICCARFEADSADPSPKSDPAANQESAISERDVTPTVPKSQLKVLLAVLASSPQLSPQSHPIKLATLNASSETPLTPVPLPAPSQPHANKHEPRSAGTLVAHWAARAGIKMLEVNPTAAGTPPPNGNGRGSEDEERGKRSHPHPHPHSHGPRGRRTSQNVNGIEGGGKAGGGLVERPPAVMQMMEMVAQPSKVVRLLARGEKLDPDP